MPGLPLPPREFSKEHTCRNQLPEGRGRRFPSRPPPFARLYHEPPELSILILPAPRPMSRAVIHFRSVLSVALVLAACTDSFGPAPELITELPRALTVAEQRVIGGANSFGLDLIREVVARDGRANIVLSPLSASMALGMTLNGADGETFDRMRATLGFAELSQALEQGLPFIRERARLRDALVGRR